MTDRYYTPDDLAAVLVGLLEWPVARRPAAIVDPHVGGGAMLRAASARWPGVPTVGLDVDPDAAGLRSADVGVCRRYEAHVLAASVPPGSVWCGNPPYEGDCGAAQASAVVASMMPGDVCGLLLPLELLAGRARWRDIWSAGRRRPCAAYILPWRPVFGGPDSTGSTGTRSVAWYVWRDGDHDGVTAVRHITPPGR